MFEITKKQLIEWLNKTTIRAVTPNMLLLGLPDDGMFKICGEEIRYVGSPKICTVMGIEVYVAPEIDKSKAYLIDKNTFNQLNIHGREG